MPLIFNRGVDESRFAIWQITEGEKYLFASAVALDAKGAAEVKSFRSARRRKEWLTLRILLKDILKVAHYNDIVYDERGKPHLKNGNGHISFSHTKNFAAVIFNPEKKVGIDIETVQPRIKKISQKFLNSSEKSFILKTHQLEMLHLIWGCKEVLFKIYGKGGINFKRHMLVHPFVISDAGSMDAELNVDGKASHFRINYFFSGKLVVVYAAG